MRIANPVPPYLCQSLPSLPALYLSLPSLCPYPLCPYPLSVPTLSLSLPTVPLSRIKHSVHTLSLPLPTAPRPYPLSLVPTHILCPYSLSLPTLSLPSVPTHCPYPPRARLCFAIQLGSHWSRILCKVWAQCHLHSMLTQLHDPLPQGSRYPEE